MRWARGDSSHGQQCQSCRGAWTRCQAADDGWRHAAGKLYRGRAHGTARQRAGARREASTALGLAEARRAALRDAGWAGFGRGPEARRWPAKEKKPFLICIFKEFLNANVQILF